MWCDPGSSLRRRCPAARAASIATRRSSDTILARNATIRLVHVVVMGSEGVGGYFGASLLRAEVKVTMVARGLHLAAMRRSGLTIRSAVEGEPVRPPVGRATQGCRASRCCLLCVKALDKTAAAPRLWSILGPDTPVLSLQNGVDSEDKIDPALGSGRAMGSVAQVFATIEAPGASSDRAHSDA